MKILMQSVGDGQIDLCFFSQYYFLFALLFVVVVLLLFFALPCLYIFW